VAQSAAESGVLIGSCCLVALRRPQEVFENFCAEAVLAKRKERDLTEVWIAQLQQVRGGMLDQSAALPAVRSAPSGVSSGS
jgi:hypothetical protein